MSKILSFVTSYFPIILTDTAGKWFSMNRFEIFRMLG